MGTPLMQYTPADAAAAERRLSLRLLAYWERLRAGRDMPTEAEIDPDQLADVWNYCFVIHASDLSMPDYNYLYLGPQLEPWLLHQKEHLNINMFTADCRRVVEGLRPFVGEGECQDAQGRILKYRHCLLPLGDNGQVQAVLGGARFKVFS